MSQRKSWFQVLENIPATVEHAAANEWVWEDGDEDKNVIKIPPDLEKMHQLAAKLIRERVQREAERDRIDRAIERADRDLEQVRAAIDAKLQEIGMRGVTRLGGSGEQ